MTVSSSRAATQFRVHIRIPRQVSIRGAVNNQPGSLADIALDIAGLTLQGHSPGQGWFDLELRGQVAAEGAVQQSVELILNTLCCEGFLASSHGLTLPVTFESDGEAASATLTPTRREQADQRMRLRVRIPARFQQEPILSNLVAVHNLSVNILGALLGSDGSHDGWFDVEVLGQGERIAAGVSYLEGLGLQVWSGLTDDDW